MSIYCVNCGVENRQEHNFCKNCGAALHGYSAPDTVANIEDTPQEEEKIYGIQSKKLKNFIGPNSNRIISRFRGMQQADSKVSFCVPAAVLGIFFGFFGLAFWFFYRKMNKSAVIFMLLGALSLSGQVFFTYREALAALPHVSHILELVFQSIGNNELILESLKQNIAPYRSSVNYVAVISDITHISALITGGLYGLYFYKNHVIKKISKISEDGTDTLVPYKKTGGVSVVMLFFGIFTTLVISVAVYVLLAIVMF